MFQSVEITHMCYIFSNKFCKGPWFPGKCSFYFAHHFLFSYRHVHISHLMLCHWRLLSSMLIQWAKISASFLRYSNSKSIKMITLVEILIYYLQKNYCSYFLLATTQKIPVIFYFAFLQNYSTSQTMIGNISNITGLKSMNLQCKT